MPINYMKLHLQGMAGTLLSIAASCSLFQSVQAGPSTFTDTSRDLMLVFRKTGFDGSFDVGQSVFEVDIGQASIYYGATPGTHIPITAYSAGTQLTNLFDDLDDFSWSISGCVPNYGDSGDPSKPITTLWLTDPRAVPSTPNTSWSRQGTYTQGAAGAHIESILAGALTYAATATNSQDNTSTALAIPYGSGYNANSYLTAVGNFGGTFPGDVENTTLPTFTTDGLPSISDFYELQPGSGQGTYLGYFELSTNGGLTFYAGPLSVSYPAPTLSVSTVGSGNVNILFLSTANGTYTLYYTNAAGLTSPVSTWATVGTNIIGDGTVKSFQQTIGAAGAYYMIGVH
jgi:hypothetical protein